MRIVKEHEERKTQIVEISERFFMEKGYENCSVSDIVKEAGIAKGTFFYYFPEKEDVLNEIISRKSVKIERECCKIAMLTGFSNEKRFLMTLLQVNKAAGLIEEKNNRATNGMSDMHKPANALMHHKSRIALQKILTPILANILRDDYDEQKNGVLEDNIMIILSAAQTLMDEEVIGKENCDMLRMLQSIFMAAAKLLGLNETVLEREWKELTNEL
ncbi:TetR family transcriptional regulator [Kineothrix alysoides]|uniref:TetR family transcriptional regulator n=1 Tax=Kineothrix alysoides TaxID=1469948 RepID=A0A4R1QQI2_9FIRM|nr:TetR/AcrR family transcriptional regulator [Kineothrix alysoides]TCL55221.1 TetR family transcriptional regulator [Kineothrix alysoides]